MQEQNAFNLVYDFGGKGSIIHLAHANGFPPGTYGPLANTFTDHYHVIGLPARPLWPGSQPSDAPNWDTLVDDLIQGLNALNLKNIIGVGHSMGGTFTMLAAIRDPSLFSKLVLIDPVILPPTRLYVLKWMRRLGLGKRQPLVQGALYRRRIWPSYKICYNHWRKKTFFKNWPDESLWAYVKSGIIERKDGKVELVYPPEWEAHVFATPPTDIWEHVPHLSIQTLVVRGEFTDVFTKDSQKQMKSLLPKVKFHVIPDAGHLLPMERPNEVYGIIRKFLDNFL